MQAAHEQRERHQDGVWFVDLTPIRDPALVLATVAATLGLRESGGQPLAELLRAFLKQRSLLLILDNVEQVIDAAPEIATLLAAAPQLQVLATSREALRLQGEQLYAVPPLVVPTGGGTEVLSAPAVQLFIARARAARADFVVDAMGASAIAAICRRLDGLPLAIELAAAHFAASLEIYRGYGNQAEMPACFGGLAIVADIRGQPQRAAQLFGAMESLFEMAKTSLDDFDLADRADLERGIATARARLGEESFDAVWAEGQAMTLEQAIAYALEDGTMQAKQPERAGAASKQRG